MVARLHAKARPCARRTVMRTMNAARAACFCLVSMVAVAACSQEVAAPASGSTAGSDNSRGRGADENATTLLASLDLGDDHKVEFYEFQPGDLGVHETGRI